MEKIEEISQTERCTGLNLTRVDARFTGAELQLGSHVESRARSKGVETENILRFLVRDAKEKIEQTFCSSEPEGRGTGDPS